MKYSFLLVTLLVVGCTAEPPPMASDRPSEPPMMRAPEYEQIRDQQIEQQQLLEDLGREIERVQDTLENVEIEVE